MIENQQRSIEILQELGANPAVPFHEQSVSNYIKAFISKLGIEMCLDPYGTIITHYQTQSTASLKNHWLALKKSAYPHQPPQPVDIPG